MDNIWWIVGFGCGGLVLLAVAGVVYLAILDSRKKKRALDEGESTTGWLVQANSKLFEDGMMDLPALVLISPDPGTAKDEDLMTDLAERIMELKGADPDDCATDAEAKIAGWMSDETYVEGRRDELPRSLTGGKEVYLAHIFVYRDHLPEKRIEGPKIPCVVIWNDPKSLICTRPLTRQERRNLRGGSEDEE
ncbi:MAG: hypothetical protein JWO38_3707 [Gemmataceae bacterium]|nr:hypothetical protein [Gemmataceae bacterium]